MFMFSRRTCQRCGEEVSKKYRFCPKCGIPLVKKEQEEDWGMLGKDDSIEEFDSFSNSLFGKMGGGMMNKMLNNALRMLEKEMQQGMRTQNQNTNNIPRTRFRLMINGKEIDLNSGNAIKSPKEEPKEKKIKFNEFTDEQIKRFSKLKKAEPKTHLKRIGDKIIYEIELPEVGSLNNISILKLENGLEIKAIAEKKAYLKRIPLTLPITGYNLSDNLFVLELKGN